MDFKTLLGTKEFTALVEEARLRLANKSLAITNWNVGASFRTLTELSMQGVSDLHTLLASVLPMGYAAYATGQWLDLKVQDIGVTRRPAKKAIGFLKLGRNATGSVIRIDSLIAKTNMSPGGDELRYFSTKEVLLSADALEVLVPVQSEFEGARYNVGQGYVKNIVTHIPGIDYITNAADWVVDEGADKEDDKSLRERYFLRWEELATGSPAMAYASWAKTVTGVLDVAVNDKHPRGQGTVDVIITSQDGLPTQTLIDEVKAAVDAKRPQCTDVLVKAPQTVPVNFDITLYLLTSEGEEAATISEAQAIIQTLFVPDTNRPTIQLQRIGSDLIKAKVNYHLMSIKSVVNAAINSPASDIPIAPDELAVRGIITIQVQRLSSL